MIDSKAQKRIGLSSAMKLKEEEERIHSLLRDPTITGRYRERQNILLRLVHRKMARIDA